MTKVVNEKKIIINSSFSKPLFGDSIGKYMIYVLLVSIIILPSLHILPDEGSFFYISGNYSEKNFIKIFFNICWFA